ncbi:MAG TPA: hypothetical protein EYO22_03805 [Candidatus Poseidoniales archaeon]|nr:hypothetical protein [Candidatus Poseidoniales archaeon]
MATFRKNVLRPVLACLLMIIVPMTGFVGSVTASTTPTHVISDQTWTAAGNPYLIDDMLVIMPDKTLTIEEGVVIEFTPTGWLDVRGDLNVLGTAADPVLFTIDSANATSTSQWGGIQLQTDDFDVDLVMRNAIVSRAMNGIFIACCHQGSILIEDSTFLNNNVGIHGYAGYDAIINNVVFMNNTVGVASSDKDISNSTFVGNEFGISSAERTDVRYSLFENNDIAAYGGRGVLLCNVIQDNRIGVQAFYEGWALEHNVIQDNSEIGVITGQYDGIVPHAWGNSFLNNGLGANTIADINVQHTNNINIDFEDNWWGTTDSNIIDATVYDFLDQSSLGLVDYTPTLNANPNGTACPGDDSPTNPDLDTNPTNPGGDVNGLNPDINETGPIGHDNYTDPDTNDTGPIGHDDETASDTNHTDHTPRISLWPGKVNQHNENGIWMTDPDGVSGGHPSTLYSSDYGDRKLEYCQKFWPNTQSIELRDNRETITFWTAGNTDSVVSTRDVYECVFNHNDTDEDADYHHQLDELQEREQQSWEDAMEECDRAWAELDEHYMMMVESLEEQMMDEIEMELWGLDDSLSIRYDEFDVQYNELLIQLSEAEDEDEAAVIIQEIQSLRESEQQVIEWVYDVYHARIADIIEQYDAMIDALDDEAFESLRHDVETDCEALFEELEEQFRAEYEALESMTEVEDENSCGDDDRCTDRDENYMEEFGIGHSVPGFTGLLSVLAITGAVLLTGRRGLHETRGRARAVNPFNDVED